MRKLVATILIALLLLNTCGYYLIFMGWQFRNDISMRQQLDSDVYDPGQTVTIKIPLAVPYMTGNQEFERADGKFECNGEIFRLVKHNYSQDTLTIVCIKDHKEKRIQEALSDFVKTFTDKAPDQQSQTKLILTFLKDYIPQNFNLRTSSDGWQVMVGNSPLSDNLIATFTSSIIHPPERG